MAQWLQYSSAGGTEPGGSEQGQTVSYYTALATAGAYLMHETYTLDVHRPKVCWGKSAPIEH